jgi:hypothetical protein
MAAIITINLVSERAESLLPALKEALHLQDDFDRSIPRKAQTYFSTEAKDHAELVSWVQGKISEHGWDDDFLVHSPAR